MASYLNRVHSCGMSPDGSTYMTVNSFVGPNNTEIPIEPPLRVIFEGDKPNVAFSQDGLAARYSNEELHVIGEGNSARGMHRVIGDIAMNGGLKEGATKPLHLSVLVVDGEVAPYVAPPGLMNEII